MQECNKNAIRVALSILQTTLTETNTAVGIMINKEDLNKSQLAFIDYDSFCNGNINDGFAVSLNELNKGFLNN